MATFTGTDPDAGDTLTYSLVDNAGGRFAINTTTGVVTVGNSQLLNFEAATSHGITVRVTDAGGLTRDLTQTITLGDVNETPVSLSLTSGGTIAENSANGTVVATFTGSDVDAGDTLTYSLVDNAGGRFAINATTGVVTVANSQLLNYEASTSHGITVRVTDGGGLTRDLTQTITLADVNETPVTLTLSSGGSVAENSANGTVVATFTGTDVDAGDTLTYSLVDNAGGRFTINASTGVVTVANGALLDFDAATSHGITVRVTDAGGLTRDLNQTITLSNVNEAPATLSLTAGGTIAENSANGSVVATFTGTDPDAGDTLTYSLVDNAGGRFAINAATGVVTVANSQLLDFEVATAHNVTVRVTDGGGLTREVTQSITLSDVQGEVLTGTAGNDTLCANLGNDTLDGAAGADSLVAGIGDDTYVIDNTGDVITENVGEGTDTVQTSITYTLGANLEVLTLLGSSAIHGYGNALGNTVFGNAGNNSLFGYDGDDILYGNDGNDRLYGGNSTGWLWDNAIGDYLNVALLDGNDTLYGGLGNDYIETGNGLNTVFGGAGNEEVWAGMENDVLYGEADSDILFGLHGNDTLDGGAGNDYLIGGLGQDLLMGGDGADFLFAGGDGNGFWSTNIHSHWQNNTSPTSGDWTSWTFNTLVGAGNTTLQGGAGNDVILGNNGNDLLEGGADNDYLRAGLGDDTLDGGTGTDTLVGNTGNDVFVVDNASDVVTESAAEGTDTIQSSISYTIAANVEVLSLTGSANLNAWGGTGNDSLVGNSGVNSLNGGAGNDTLDGGLGGDTMVGSTGDDLYLVDNASDIVTESSGHGTDTIRASITYTLAANAEILSLTGSANINAFGTTGNDTLVGNSGNNSLDGGSGNDTLDGGVGADTMNGGAGDDTYFIDNAGDVITDSSGGYDNVILFGPIATYTLASNMEAMWGWSDIAYTLYSNNTYGELYGATQNDTLIGGNADDWLWGQAGQDSMAGGTGNDKYHIDNVGDIVTEAVGAGTDTVFTHITYTMADNVEILTILGSGDLSAFGNALNNTMTGNASNNTLDGGVGADTMIGGSGNDTYIVDNTGDVVTESSGQGSDTILSSVSYTLASSADVLSLTGSANLNAWGTSTNDTLLGNDGVNSLSGNNGSDYLDGGIGADTMVGGSGNDTYIVDNISDVVTESSGQGTDTLLSSVSYTLAGNAEVLSLTGSANLTAWGTTGSDTLVGNAGNNSLFGNNNNDNLNGGEGDDTLDGGAGNDYLDGGLGADTLIGGSSNNNDTFIVDNAGDVVSEAGSGGTDTIRASVSYTIAANVEMLSLTGSDNIHAWGGTGNDSLVGNSGANTLTGGAGNDNLDGGSGADTLIGGTGNDTYTVDHINDVVTEALGEGTDTLLSSITYTIAANVEFMTLTGAANINAFGDSTNNTIRGTTGDNLLEGRAGNDFLEGGQGRDSVFGGDGDDVLEGGWGNTDPFTQTVGDYLDGGAGNDTIYASDSTVSDTVMGGTGNDSLYAGYGDDIYVFNGIGDGVDVVDEYTAAWGMSWGGGNDTFQISTGGGLTRNNIALFRNGDDLQIGYVGTTSATDLITIKDHFNASNIGRMETITYTGDNFYLSHTAISNIVTNMSNYASANSITLTDIETVKANTDLMNIINAGWTS